MNWRWWDSEGGRWRNGNELVTVSMSVSRGQSVERGGGAVIEKPICNVACCVFHSQVQLLRLSSDTVSVSQS